MEVPGATSLVVSRLGSELSDKKWSRVGDHDRARPMKQYLQVGAPFGEFINAICMAL